jgi:hypothetical protein
MNNPHGIAHGKYGNMLVKIIEDFFRTTLEGRCDGMHVRQEFGFVL